MSKAYKVEHLYFYTGYDIKSIAGLMDMPEEEVKKILNLKED